MRRTRWVTSGVCAGLLLSGGRALAKEPATRAQTQRLDSDGEFLKQALGVNELELKLGRLAVERSSTPESKAKAQKMVENHTKLGQQLSDLAQQAGLSGNAEMSPDQTETFARVESQRGRSFDTAFKQTIDAGHVKELAMYQAEVSRAANPQLRALAEQRVAALQQALGVEQPAKATRKEEQ